MLNPENRTLNPCGTPSHTARYYLFPIPHTLNPPATIGVFTGLFVLAAAVFAWRRVSGALLNPLPVDLLIPSGLLACLSALGIRTLRQRADDGKQFSQGELVFDIILGASLLIFAAAVSLPGTNAWGLGVFWLFIAAEEIWAWRRPAGQWLRRLGSKKIAIRPLRVDPIQAISAPAEPAAPQPAIVNNSLTLPAWFAKDITQQLTRSTAADGSDVFSGWLRLDFAAGQRMGHLHVAFCPPFDATPELTVSQQEGPEARIKIAQLLPYGARLDLKLVGFSAVPASVLVQFSAQSQPARKGNEFEIVLPKKICHSEHSEDSVELSAIGCQQSAYTPIA